MIVKLYVVGNGFDLYHGIPSSYWNFAQFLKVMDEETYDEVERHFEDGFWSDFEAQLAAFDSDGLVDDATEFLVSYGADDWSDSYHHDYQYVINRAVKAVSTDMRRLFGDWVRQLTMPDPANLTVRRVPIDLTARFLNFNYTPSLQALYGVDDANILHIHGSAKDPTAQLVLGHGWQPSPSRPSSASDWEEDDVRVAEGQILINEYFRATFKPTAEIIRANAGFFASLSDVEQIFVLGHSLSEVDHPYLREIVSHVDIARVRWKISYRDKLDELRARVASLGIPMDLVKFVELARF